MSAVVDGEIEGYGAVATSGVISGVCWCVGADMIGVVVPNEAVAGGDSLNGTIAIIDSQVQGVCTWTTVIVGVIMGKYSRSMVVNFVP